MSKFFTFIAVIAVVLLGATGAVAAQESSNGSATPVATEEPTGSSATIELSPTTKITEWRYENGTFFVTFEVDRPTGIAITDAGKLTQILSEGDGAAAGKARVRRLGLTSGRTTVKFRAEQYGGAAAITITSSNSNGIVAIRSDAMRPTRPPVEYGTVQGLLATTAIAAAGGTFLYVRRKRDEKEMEVVREW